MMWPVLLEYFQQAKAIDAARNQALAQHVAVSVSKMFRR